MDRSRIHVVRSDITTVAVDAVVNAANSGLLGGGGVDGAIHEAAGPDLDRQCRALRCSALPDGLPTGRAVATGAGRMGCRWIIHTVGPIWGGSSRDETLLASCYRSSLAVAEALGVRSVAFPTISAGVYGCPMDIATRVAVQSCLRASTSVEEVLLVAFNDAAERGYRESLT